MKKHLFLGAILWFSAVVLGVPQSFADLLNVSLGYPRIAYDSANPFAVNYTASNQLFSVGATANVIVFAKAGTPINISGTSNLQIQIKVDNTGVLVGGVEGDDLLVSGTVAQVVGGVTNTYSGVLLTGEVTGFGFFPPVAGESSGSLYDFRFTVTGGALSNFFSCGNISVKLDSNNSTFTGNFATNFNGWADGYVALENLTMLPSPLTATAVSSSQIDLSWTDNSTNEDGFAIERAPDSSGSPGTWAQIATVGANVTNYSDTELSPNTTYWYRVRAYNSCGDSNYSNQTSARTLTPSHLVVTPDSLDYGSVTVGQTSNQNFLVINTGDVSLSGTAALEDAGPFEDQGKLRTVSKGKTFHVVAAGPFGITSGAEYTVAGGQTGTVTVTFAPSAPGTANGSVIFTSNGGDSTNDVTGIGVCTYTLSAPGGAFGTTGGSGSFTVNTPGGCAWTPSTTYEWIHITGAGPGTGPVNFTVDVNASANLRTGTIIVQDQTFTVTQAGDTTPPTVVLTEPTSGIVSNTITVSATATDNVAVVKVEFYLDGSLFSTVTTSPYNVSFDTTTVGNGSHCFYAKAYDNAGNVSSSATNCVTVNNTAAAPSLLVELTVSAVSTGQLNLSWSGGGSSVASYGVVRDGTQIVTTASSNYSDNGLAAGSNYCYVVVAYDGGGIELARSTEKCARTLVTPGSLRGTYNGLVIQTNTPTHESSGSIKLVVGETGSFCADLTMGGVERDLEGQFDAAGNATNKVARGKLHPLQVILHLDLADGTDQITGTVSDGVFTSELLADREVYNQTNPCPLAGRYTVVLVPPEGDAANIPQGNGYGSITVTTVGSGKLRGVLSDGTKITGNAPVSKYGTWPLYDALYEKRGSCIGWVTLATNGTVEATVDWFRPEIRTARYYPSGFATNVTLVGEKYVSPSAGGPSPAGARQITLGVGNLVQDVSIDAAGNVTASLPNSQNLKMKLQPLTGLFRGSFRHPSLGGTINFKGAVLQSDHSGAGYFLGANESGFVVIAP
ncbi:MAG: Ig-like domain-containing protein [Verrucomicrobiia bacterium]